MRYLIAFLLLASPIAAHADFTGLNPSVPRAEISRPWYPQERFDMFSECIKFYPKFYCTELFHVTNSNYGFELTN